jgi:hypothetical protein
MAAGEEPTVGRLCRRLPVLPADRAVLDALRDGAFARGAVLVQDGGVFGLVTPADLEHAAALHGAPPAGRS